MLQKGKSKYLTPYFIITLFFIYLFFFFIFLKCLNFDKSHFRGKTVLLKINLHFTG